MQRRISAGIIVASMLAALAAWPQRAPVLHAQGPAQVQPGDITTPTPRPDAPLLPTSTPQGQIPGIEPTSDNEADAQPDSTSGGSVYVVREGDTLWSVAVEIGVDLEDMHCVVSPDFQWDEPIVVGDELDIPPPGFACHTVQAGETLESIAAQYGVLPAAIQQTTWNRLPQAPDAHVRLPMGAHLRVPPPYAAAGSGGGLLLQMLDRPVGSSPLAFAPFASGALRAIGGPGSDGTVLKQAAQVPSDWPYGSGYFAWPTTGWLSQGYRLDHRALDIASPPGTFVIAADRGVVIRAGWNDQGYGRFVVIDHNIDYVTLYAHLDEVLVEESQVVGQGDIIGTIGSTGNSTGPHLHFEIRDFGRRVNPLDLLLAYH